MLNELIEKSVLKGIGYKAYVEMVKQLVAAGKASGPNQSPEYVGHTELNSARMRRLDKTFKISEEELSVFRELEGEQTWLVISESWCGDAAQALPILNRIVSGVEGIDLKIVLRDEHPELMDHFLTNGTRSIPKLIILDQNHQVVDSWGPRSAAAAKIVADYKAAHGAIDDTLVLELQKWYIQDKGRAIVRDLLELVREKTI